MTELMRIDTHPLAVTPAGEPIDTADADVFTIKRLTGGRPEMIRDEDGNQVLLNITASKRDLRRAVGYEPGVFRLFPCDQHGIPLDLPFAEIELTPEDVGQYRPNAGDPAILERMTGLMEQCFESNRSTMAMVCDLLRTQSTAMIEQQRSSAEMLRVANETIKVANGVDAVERPPPPAVDVEALARNVAKTLAHETETQHKPAENWMSQFAKSPMFPMVAQLVQGFVQPFMAVQQARMQTAMASASAKQTSPQQSAELSQQPPPQEPMSVEVEQVETAPQKPEYKTVADENAVSSSISIAPSVDVVITSSVKSPDVEMRTMELTLPPDRTDEPQAIGDECTTEGTREVVCPDQNSPVDTRSLDDSGDVPNPEETGPGLQGDSPGPEELASPVQNSPPSPGQVQRSKSARTDLRTTHGSHGSKLEERPLHHDSEPSTDGPDERPRAHRPTNGETSWD